MKTIYKKEYKILYILNNIYIKDIYDSKFQIFLRKNRY